MSKKETVFVVVVGSLWPVKHGAFRADSLLVLCVVYSVTNNHPSNGWWSDVDVSSKGRYDMLM